MSASKMLSKLASKKSSEAKSSKQSKSSADTGAHPIGAIVSDAHTPPKGPPVRLPCGHMDWDYNAMTGVCGECRNGVYVLKVDRLAGLILSMVVSDQVGDLERSEALLKEAREFIGADETFSRYTYKELSSVSASRT